MQDAGFLEPLRRTSIMIDVLLLPFIELSNIALLACMRKIQQSFTHQTGVSKFYTRFLHLRTILLSPTFSFKFTNGCSLLESGFGEYLGYMVSIISSMIGTVSLCSGKANVGKTMGCLIISFSTRMEFIDGIYSHVVDILRRVLVVLGKHRLSQGGV